MDRRDPVVGVRLGGPILAKLDGIAREQGLTRSQMVRRLVVGGLLDDERRRRDSTLTSEGGD